MIDPHSFTNFERDERDLQEALMFAIVVAGKRADQQAKKLDQLLRDVDWWLKTQFSAVLMTQVSGVDRWRFTDLTPLGGLWSLAHMYDHRSLEKIVKRNKIGQYDRILRCFTHLAYRLPQTEQDDVLQHAVDKERLIDLKTVSAAELEQVFGIGPKTARFFILHTRRNAEVACLDTHILRYMREELGIRTPKSTPSGKKYLELEQAFLAHAKELGRDVAELDLDIWTRYTKSSPTLAMAA